MKSPLPTSPVGFLSVAFGAVLIGLVACGAPSSDPAAPTAQGDDSRISSNVLATFEDGEITADQLDQAILSLPVAQRQQLALESQDAYSELVRELAMDTLLLREARLQGIDQAPEIQSQERALRRNILVQRYLETHLPRIDPPNEQEIQAEYDRRKDEFQRPERRLVFHLFRRLDAGASKDDLKAEVAQLRQQVLDGQGFSVLASRHSDSESRHQEGQLGWFEPGQLDPDLDAVIFSLEEGVPSQPIVTRDGVHLFLVDVVVEAKKLSVDEAKPQFFPDLLDQHRRTAMATLVDGLNMDAEVFQPTYDELRVILSRNNPGEVVLRVDDYELRLDAFSAMLDNDAAQRPSAAPNRAEQVLERVLQGELIFQHQLANGTRLTDEEAQQVAHQAEALLTFQGRQLKMRLHLDRDPEALKTFFEDNRMRFTSPLKLRLRQLSVPLGDHPSDRMALLERRTQDANAEDSVGETSLLESLASDLGGQVEDIGWKSLAELRLMNRHSVRLISDIPAGHYSPPFSTAEALRIVHVVEREEPSPLPYETARDSVRRAYIERHGQRLYGAVQNDMLEKAGFALYQDNLDALLASGIAQTE